MDANNAAILSRPVDGPGKRCTLQSPKNRIPKLSLQNKLGCNPWHTSGQCNHVSINIGVRVPAPPLNRTMGRHCNSASEEILLAILREGAGTATGQKVDHSLAFCRPRACAITNTANE